MRIRELDISINLNLREVEIMAYALSTKLKKSVEDHCKYHRLVVFIEQTEKERELLEFLFDILGYGQTGGDIISSCEAIIKKEQEDKDK